MVEYYIGVYHLWKFILELENLRYDAGSGKKTREILDRPYQVPQTIPNISGQSRTDNKQPLKGSFRLWLVTLLHTRYLTQFTPMRCASLPSLDRKTIKGQGTSWILIWIGSVEPEIQNTGKKYQDKNNPAFTNDFINEKWNEITEIIQKFDPPLPGKIDNGTRIYWNYFPFLE